MRNQMKSNYIAGTSALKYDFEQEGASQIIEFPRQRVSTSGQHVRRRSCGDCIERRIGSENYRNLVGAENALSKMQMVLGGMVTLAGGLFVIALEILL